MFITVKNISYKLFFDGEYVQYNTTIYNKINLKHYTYYIDILPCHAFNIVLKLSRIVLSFILLGNEFQMCVPE